jgi:hypothetical protein
MKINLLIALAVLVVLAGCSPTTQPQLSGGGNDFPNPPSSAALGKLIADNLSTGAHWADSVQLPAPSSPAALAQSVSVPSATSTGMAKKATTSETLRFDLSDTGNGVVRVFYGLVSDTIIKNDTIYVLYDDAFRDGIRNNEHLYSLKGASIDRRTLVRSSYLFVDSDGDSIMNNRDGKPNRVFVSISTASPLDPIAQFDIEIGAGKDGNLDTKSTLRILQCQSLSLSRKGDTLSMVRYEKYRGDSVIFDAASRDSLLVRVRFIDTDILQRRTCAEAIFLIFPADTIKNRPMYFRSVKSLESGAAITSLVRGSGPDSLFKANDTALAYIIAERPVSEASLDTLILRILTGNNPAGAAGNALLGLYSHKFKRTGDDRETIISLTCDQPVAPGDTVQSGKFSLKLLYSDGRWISIVGAVTPSTISAQYEDSKGNKKMLDWDRNGNPR